MHAESIPAIVAAATIAAEDRRFWSHHGIDPIAVLRAIKQNVAEGSIVEGGSTITQQAAKLLMLRRAADRRRGWRTKLHEAVIALRHNRVDAAVLDINLGGESVYPLADILRAENIPFIFVTGYGSEELDSRFSTVPVLQKPIEAAKLHALLQQIVR